MSESTIHHRIYNNIARIIPDLEKHLEQGTESGKSQLEPFMDLHYDYLRKDGDAHVIAFAHYFEQNGDRVPDPDMEVLIDTEHKTAEALTFQNQFTYDEVYPDGDKNHYNPKLKRDLNEFLLQWMKNARVQDHSIVMNTPEVEHDTPEQQATIEKETPSDELAALREKSDNAQEKSQGLTR